MKVVVFLRHIFVETYFLIIEMRRPLYRLFIIVAMLGSMLVCCEQAHDKQKNAEKYRKLNELDKENSIGDGVRAKNLCWSCDRN